MKNYLLLFMLLALSINVKADFRFTFNDHTYDVITTSTSWLNASIDANARHINGTSGYLVHIDDEFENEKIKAVLYDNIPDSDFQKTLSVDGGFNLPSVWIGANDISAKGVWSWDDNGLQFWQGDASGSIVNGRYNNWGTVGIGEPSNDKEQNSAVIHLVDWSFGKEYQWDDVSPDNKLYYIVEYNTTTSMSNREKAEIIFNQFEAVYGNDSIFPPASTEVINDSSFVRWYDSSIKGVLVVNEQISTLSEDKWVYYSTLDEANEKLCHGSCFYEPPMAKDEKVSHLLNTENKNIATQDDSTFLNSEIEPVSLAPITKPKRIAVFVNGNNNCCAHRMTLVMDAIKNMGIEIKQTSGGSEANTASWNDINNANIGTLGTDYDSVTRGTQNFIATATEYFDSLEDGTEVFLFGHSFGGHSILKFLRAYNITNSKLIFRFVAVLDPVAGGGFRSTVIPLAPPKEVDYFFNRWQENLPMPFDFGNVSGWIPGCTSNCNQSRQNTSRESDGTAKRTECSKIEICAGARTVYKGLKSYYYPGTKYSDLHHADVPADHFIQTQIIDIIQRLVKETNSTIIIRPLPPKPKEIINSVSWKVTDGCNDTHRINYKFFDTSTKRVWPSPVSSYFTKQFNEAITSKLSCTEGEKICIGGNTGTFFWGKGIEGKETCEKCCVTCDGKTHGYTMGCTQVGNRKPDAQPHSWQLLLNRGITFTPDAKDPENDPLTFSILTQPSNGIATTNGSKITYIPEDGFDGNDSFRYRVTDSFGLSDDDVITVSVIRPKKIMVVNSTGNGRVTSNPDGIDCNSSCTADFALDSYIALKAIPDNSSVFLGWSGDCSGNDMYDCKVTMNAARIIIAKFAPAPTGFVLDVNKAGNGSGTVSSDLSGIDCGSDCSEEYTGLATKISLTATPDNNSIFRGWSGDCLGTGLCAVTLDTLSSIKNVIATFTALTPTTFTVTNLNDRGSGSLRQAIEAANSNAGVDTILFADELNGTINLTTGQLAITEGVIIDGSGAKILAISGNHASRIFEIDSEAFGTVAISGLTLKEGYDVSGNGGGAIMIDSGTVNISNSNLSSNAAIVDYGGGGAIRNYGSLTISNSTLSSNTAGSEADGGAVRNSRTPSVVAGILTIINSTLSGNSARFGGGILIDGGVATISNSTLSGNSSSPDFGSGGGIYFNFVGDAGELRLSNSIIAGNTSPHDKEIANGIFVSKGHNLFGENGISGVAAGATLATNDLILAGTITTAIYPLADNGGQTLTHLPVAGSVVIDAGDNNLILQGVTTDQRGIDFARIMNGTVDIGAVERIIKHTLSVSQTGGSGTITSDVSGIACNIDCSASFNSGTAVTLIATPASGFRFAGWSGACSGIGSCVVSMTSANSVIANFIVEPVVTVVATTNSASEVGLITGTFTFTRTGSTDTALTVAYSVTGTATAGNDYLSIESSVTIPAGASTATKTITPLPDIIQELDETILITLTQSPDYTLGIQGSATVILTNGNTLLVVKNGEGKVLSNLVGIDCGVNCNQIYTNDTSVTLTAIPEPGYFFTGWSGACNGAVMSCILTMNAANNVTANFVWLHRSSWKRALIH